MATSTDTWAWQAIRMGMRWHKRMVIRRATRCGVPGRRSRHGASRCCSVRLRGKLLEIGELARRDSQGSRRFSSETGALFAEDGYLGGWNFQAHKTVIGIEIQKHF